MTGCGKGGGKHGCGDGDRVGMRRQVRDEVTGHGDSGRPGPGHGSTHHGEVVVERLEGAAEQRGAVGVGHAADAAAVVGRPEAQRPVQGSRHEDVVGKRPGEIRHAAVVATQHPQHRRRPRSQAAHGNGAVQRAAGQQVTVIVGKLHLGHCKQRQPGARQPSDPPRFVPSAPHYRRCLCAGRTRDKRRRRRSSRSALCPQPWHGSPPPAVWAPRLGGCGVGDGAGTPTL